jgi:hypothetical protein
VSFSRKLVVSGKIIKEQSNPPHKNLAGHEDLPGFCDYALNKFLTISANFLKTVTLQWVYLRVSWSREKYPNFPGNFVVTYTGVLAFQFPGK